MDLKIFDVEHGQCALFILDDGKTIMIDVGHNGTTGWKPAPYLRNTHKISALDMLVITNFDHDHVSGLNNLLDNIEVRTLLRNKQVTPDELREIKKATGESHSITRLIKEMRNTYTAPGVTFSSPGFDYEVFWHPYGTFTDTNNLSLVFFAKCHGVGILFPGDLERAGWLKMLEREAFRQVLRQTNVLIASHHGRDNGCCDEVFDYPVAAGATYKLCYPHYIILSDKSHAHDTQKTLGYYGDKAQGGPYGGVTRKVLTTRNDGRIGFTLTKEAWWPY